MGRRIMEGTRRRIMGGMGRRIMEGTGRRITGGIVAEYRVQPKRNRDCEE
jgi:hypothetical protein